MKISTVNVVEYADDDLVGIASFEDSKDGIIEAGEHFKAILEENGDNLSPKDIDTFIEDEYWEQGNLQVFISHSS